MKGTMKISVVCKNYGHRLICIVPDQQQQQLQPNCKSNRTVGRINGQYSSADYTPIWYATKDLDSFEDVAALYAAADAALLTPLREGMNLTYMLCCVVLC